MCEYVSVRVHVCVSVHVCEISFKISYLFSWIIFLYKLKKVVLTCLV